jgi:hypothetical protein
MNKCQLQARRVDEKTVKIIVRDTFGQEVSSTLVTTGHAQQTADAINDAIEFLDNCEEN